MRNHQKGFTLIELLIACAIVAILGAIVVGQMGQQIMLAHETAATQEIRAIHTGEAQYFAQFGKFDGLVVLGQAKLIPENLASGKKSGYLIEVGVTADGYAVTAVPQKFGSSGRRSFYSDQTLVIRASWTTQAANAGSPPVE